MDGGDANSRASLVQTLGHWKVDVNLAGVRDPEALAKLPEPERKEWQSLWGDVEALLERAQGHPAKTVATASRMPAKAPEPAPNPTAAAVKHPVGRPAPGRKRSARGQIDPGNSSGPGPCRDLQEEKSPEHRARDRGPRDLRGGGRSFACPCPDAHPQRGLLRRASQRLASTCRIPAAGILSGPDHSFGRARLGRVRRRGSPQANARDDGVGSARQDRPRGRSPTRPRSQQGFRLSSRSTFHRTAGLKAISITTMQRCPGRSSSPRRACHRLITRSTSRRQATWASSVPSPEAR